MSCLEGELIEKGERPLDKPIEIATKYIGVIGEFLDDKKVERIISGREIDAWERDCWPWHMFSHGGGCTKKNYISGSLGFLDFFKDNLDEYKSKDVDFAYFESDALIINTIGIELQGSKRLRDDMRIPEGTDTSAMVFKSMIQNLEKIAKQRNIPIIGVRSDSIYNFYPGNYDDIPFELTQSIYNAPYHGMKFQRFKDKKGGYLHRLSTKLAKPNLLLYSLVDL